MDSFLQYKENWEMARKRMEAWWEGEIIDRAVIQVTAPRRDNDLKPDKKEEQETVQDLEKQFIDPDIVIPRKEKKIKNTYFGGEAFPMMLPTQGMVNIISNYLGSPMKFIDKQTIWSEPIIDDWSDLPDLSFNPENEWWQVSKQLLKKSAENAPGKYFVGIPDLNGPSEILSTLRGSDKLAIDTIENKVEFKNALKEINYTWYRYWQACHGIVHQYIGGYINWMGIWSDIAATDLQSDFSCMISKESYDELILPFIRQQTEWIPRTIYHLDGPGAVRHLDSLLSLDKLTAIQWIPGAGAAPPSKWLNLLKKIQKAGKRIQIFVEKEEVEILLKKLNPEGLLMKTSCNTIKEAEELIEKVKKLT